MPTEHPFNAAGEESGSKEVGVGLRAQGKLQPLPLMHSKSHLISNSAVRKKIKKAKKKAKKKNQPSNPACIKVVLTLVSDSGLGGSIQRNPRCERVLEVDQRELRCRLLKDPNVLVQIWLAAGVEHPGADSSSYTDTSPLPIVLR